MVILFLDKQIILGVRSAEPETIQDGTESVALMVLFLMVILLTKQLSTTFFEWSKSAPNVRFFSIGEFDRICLASAIGRIWLLCEIGIVGNYYFFWKLIRKKKLQKTRDHIFRTCIGKTNESVYLSYFSRNALMLKEEPDSLKISSSTNACCSFR